MIGSQKVSENVKYRPFFYMKKLSVEEGSLLLNLLTHEMIFLNKIELLSFTNDIEIDSDLTRELVAKWFLVPNDFNDLQLAEQVENMMKLTNKLYKSNKYSTFTILTTTDCNARCFYCVERGAAKKVMSAQTAYDIADFIIKNKLTSKVYLRWFGGEPLYNHEVIDIICNRLKEEKIEYESHMTSNGYLFDEQMIAKAIDLWNLTNTQITLDGTEEKYNRIKNYIYNEGSAFLKVLNNIELLSKFNINVRIRMNIDQNNIDDLYNLTDELFERFGDIDNIKIYCALIFEESCAYMKRMGDDDRRNLVEKQVGLEKYILEKGKYSIDSKLFRERFAHCMADDTHSVLILPDGNLGKCQSIIDSNFIGSIYDEKLNSKMLDWYKDIKTISNKCDSCIFRPTCIYPKCCVISLQNCTDLDKQLIINRIETQMLKYYDNMKR